MCCVWLPSMREWCSARPPRNFAEGLPSLLEGQLAAVLDDQRMALTGLHASSALLLELHEVTVEALNIR
eukprot:CAMPEP_0183558548 /NCGR_PEP_ID=MMETSP0371-20130417/88982_1 /TAXON_ID=268820 /ORGANISM="Peridinium aciculiferum, Strain PAER-2" /LENGTH=68 /DNA_ID=CAMNT_0025766005 /DNA_START=216 /DNA_END=419 /DNA_ORIENTATION=-